MKTLLALLITLLATTAQAQVTHLVPDEQLLNSGITIIDIRTEGEWKQTGLVKGAIPITFFDERGAYNAQEFLNSLQQHTDPGQPIAVICRTGNRTRAVSQFLSEQGYQVTNLQGGIAKLIREGYQPVSYNQRLTELSATGSCTPSPKGC
jgi:rhodanese-related sulfurtransferase